MSKDMAKSLVAAALTVAFSTPVAANTATGSHTASVAFSKQADGIVMPTDADGSNGSNASGGLVGLEFLKGKTEEEIKKAALTPGSELNDNKPDEVFFLYNVKTGKFLNAGGYWGTHVSLKDYPLSLWAEKHTYGTQTLIDFKQNMETGQDKYLGWAGKDGGTGTDDGVFIDRKQNEDTHYGWVFEPQNDGKTHIKFIHTQPIILLLQAQNIIFVQMEMKQTKIKTVKHIVMLILRKKHWRLQHMARAVNAADL